LKSFLSKKKYIQFFSKKMVIRIHSRRRSPSTIIIPETVHEYHIPTYESTLNNNIIYQQKLFIPQLIYHKAEEDKKGISSFRLKLDFLDDFFPWNRQIALLIFVWGLCGIKWNFKQDASVGEALSGIFFIFGSLLLVLNILLDMGGTWIREKVELWQYQRWCQAQRIFTEASKNQ